MHNACARLKGAIIIIISSSSFSSSFLKVKIMSSLWLHFDRWCVCDTFSRSCRCGWVCNRHGRVSPLQEMYQHLRKLHLQVPRRLRPAIHQWEIPVHRYCHHGLHVGTTHTHRTQELALAFEVLIYWDFSPSWIDALLKHALQMCSCTVFLPFNHPSHSHWPLIDVTKRDQQEKPSAFVLC